MRQLATDACVGSKLRTVVELEYHRHLEPKLEHFGSLGVVWVEVVLGLLDPDDPSADVRRERTRRGFDETSLETSDRGRVRRW